MAKATSSPRGGGATNPGAGLDVSDQVFDRMVRLEHFFEENWKPLVAALSAAILVACVVVAVYEYRNRRAEKAAGAWYEAASLESETGRREALRAVAKDFPATGAGIQAAFDAAQIAVDDKDYDEAVGLYQQVVARSGGTAIGAAARMALGATYEAQGNTAQAEAAYQAVLNDQPNAYVAPQAHLALGRLAEAAGRTGDALEHYQAVVDAGIAVVWTEAAQGRIDALGAAAPALPAADTADAP